MSDVDLVGLFTRQLGLCKLKPGEAMAVLTGPNSRDDYAKAFLSAARSMGAHAYRLDLPARAPDPDGRAAGTYLTLLTGHQAAITALKSADIIIDLLGLLHSPEQMELQRAGARILMVAEPPDILERMVPRPGQRERVERSVKRLAAARVLRVTSKRGTDVTYKIGDYPPIGQYGFTDEAGRWDHFPGSFAYLWPNEGQSQGTIVLQEGDILLPFKEFVRSEIRIEIENGFITSVTGGYDARHMRTYLEGWKSRDAYAMAHVGWGLDETAIWNTMTDYNKESILGQDARAFNGNVLWSTGPNTDVGGSRNIQAHLDVAMRDCSLTLDGEPILIDGGLIPDDLRYRD